MFPWKSVVSVAQRAFGSLENPWEFLADCQRCVVEYKTIKRPKKDGRTRLIQAPAAGLKKLQRGILHLISFWPADVCQFGFVPGRSCLDNALAHVHKYKRQKVEIQALPRWLVRIDLKDAFPSVRDFHLEALFREMFSPLLAVNFPEIGLERQREFYEELVRQFVRLTTYQGKLPQGAPCSPYLLNLILFQTGIIAKLKAKARERIHKLTSKSHQITPFELSVYADDIIFTSLKDRIPNRFIREVVAIIEENGIFRINPDKLRRSSSKYKAHLITGVVLTAREENKHFLTLPQKLRKSYRGKLYRVTSLLKIGCLPDKERDGLSFDQVLGIRSRIKDVFGEQALPADLRKVVADFDLAWEEFKGGYPQEGFSI